MATAAPSGMNAALLLDPTLAGDTQALGQQQQLAQMLLEQGFAPQGTQMAGNVAIRNSPVSSLAKLAQILSGQNIQGQSNQLANSLAARQSAALMPLYFGQGGGQPGAQPDGQGGGQGAPQGQPMSQGGPLTIPGMDPRRAFVASQMYPDAYGKALVQSQTPNETSIQAMQGQMDPVIANRMAFLKANTDPKILAMRQAGMSDQDIYNAVYGAASKAADIERRPGQLYSNALTGERGMVGAIPPGSNAGSIAPNGNVSGVTPIPGAQTVMGGNQHAKEANKIISVTMSDGSVVPMWGGNAAGGGTMPAPNSPPPMQPPGPAMGPSGVSGGPIQRRTIGQSTSDAAIQKTTADAIANAPQIVAQTKSASQGLQNALGIVESGINTGGSTAKTANIEGILQNFGIPVGASSVQNYQLLQKYLQNSLDQATAGTGASGSDARYEAFAHGQPNADTMNAPALAHAIRYVLSQQDAAIARGNMLTQVYQRAQQAGAPNPALAAQQAWSKAYNPEFFQFNRMTPTDQAAFLKTQSDPRAFVQRYNQYAAQTGWVH